MKLRADVEFDELLRYGFKKENNVFAREIIRYKFGTETSHIEIFTCDINGNEDRNVYLFNDLAGGAIDDDVLDKLRELIVAGLIEAPKLILPAPKPIEADTKTLDEFWTMMRGVLEKTLETCGLVVKLVTNDEKDKEE